MLSRMLQSSFVNFSAYVDAVCCFFLFSQELHSRAEPWTVPKIVVFNSQTESKWFNLFLSDFCTLSMQRNELINSFAHIFMLPVSISVFFLVDLVSNPRGAFKMLTKSDHRNSIFAFKIAIDMRILFFSVWVWVNWQIKEHRTEPQINK